MGHQGQIPQPPGVSFWSPVPAPLSSPRLCIYQVLSHLWALHTGLPWLRSAASCLSFKAQLTSTPWKLLCLRQTVTSSEGPLLALASDPAPHTASTEME